MIFGQKPDEANRWIRSVLHDSLRVLKATGLFVCCKLDSFMSCSYKQIATSAEKVKGFGLYENLTGKYAVRS